VSVDFEIFLRVGETLISILISTGRENRRNERLEEGCEMRKMEDREIIYRCLFLGSLCKYSTRKK